MAWNGVRLLRILVHVTGLDRMSAEGAVSPPRGNNHNKGGPYSLEISPHRRY